MKSSQRLAASGVGGVFHRCARVDGGRILRRGNVHRLNRMARLLLKHCLRLPGHARLHLALHEPERRLTVVDVGQLGRAVAHLRLIDSGDKCFAARFRERFLDLSGDALELGVGHGQPDIGTAEDPRGSRRAPGCLWAP